MDAPGSYARLAEMFREKGSVLVAFSGGVDSAVLAKLAADVLGPRGLAVIVDSESYAREEKEAALGFAQAMDVPVEVRWHSELADERYVANPIDRCYFCRDGLGEVVNALAKEKGFAAVAVGTNMDDLGDWRPGLKAIREKGLWQPFVELGLAKADVRALAHHMRLPVWNKPSMACLSSRIPYGERIDITKLTRIGRAEAAVRELGFAQVRVRTFDGTATDGSGDGAPGRVGSRARIETEDPARAAALEAELRARLAPLGYTHVEVDPKGYRTGALHEHLTLRPSP